MMVRKGEGVMARKGTSPEQLDVAVASINKGKKIIADSTSAKEREEHELEIQKVRVMNRGVERREVAW